MTDTPSGSEERLAPVLKAAMALAAEKGWSAVSLAEVAERAGLRLTELYRLIPGKGALLPALSRTVDAAVLAGGPADAEERPRDRLFDVLMRRFDALAPYRDGLRAVRQAARRDPVTALAAGVQMRRSMAWMLEAAGLPSDGLGGAVRTRGLVAVWLSVTDTWLGDDSPDLAKTMAALDARLRQAESLWNSLRRPCASRRTGTRTGAAEGAAAAVSRPEV